MTARYLRDLDPAMGRAQQLSVFEQQRGRAELVNELPGLLEQVPAKAVQKAAATLRADNRAVLELRPESAA
jgi:predicted Zn-dependent peptidase